MGKDDILYDLGSETAVLSSLAAKEFGARGVGIDIDPELVRRLAKNAVKAGVADKVKFQKAGSVRDRHSRGHRGHSLSSA